MTSTISDSANGNRLLLGEAAVIPGTIDIPVKMPVDLNFKTKQEVLELRKEAVAAAPNLVAAPYEPSEAVFSKIEDRRPWWGMRGQSVWGPGPKSSDGAAEESRFLLNPYVICGANSASAEIWDTKKITEADLDRDNFPYCWHPSLVRWWPQQRLAQIEYEVTKFNENLTAWRDKLKEQKIIPAFGVTAYNAADFNLHYIYIDPKRSIHIENVNKVPAAPVKIVQYIHCGGTCKIPGGCNNMSPEMKAVDKIKYTSLPARACVMLWQEKPASIATKSDLTVYIDLK